MPQQRRALGKGIGALIPSATARRSEPTSATHPPSTDEERVEKIPLEAIDLNPRQPRVHFDEELLRSLAESVRARGVLQPILVRPRAPGRYELVAGERRLRASQTAGLDRIPALVKQLSDDESLLLAIVENVQRADLNPLEEAQGYQALLKDFGLTQEEIAQRVGKSRPAIANSLRLLQLPEATRVEIRAGRLSAGHARALLGLEDGTARASLVRKISEEGLSVRETEKAVQKARAKPAPSPAPATDPDVSRMETDLSRALGTKVTIAASRAGKGHGRVEINYYSDDDLARVVEMLKSVARSGQAQSARA